MIYRVVFKINANSPILVSKAQITNSHNVCVLSEKNELVSLHFATINLPMVPVNGSCYHLTACIIQISGVTLITTTFIIGTNRHSG